MLVRGIMLREGQYELIERCGAGGQGDVWIVKDTGTSMLRAAKISKILWSERSDHHHAQMRSAYDKETETLKALDNRHVVTIIDFFTDNVALSDGADGESEYLCQCVVMERAELGDMGRSSNSGEFRQLPARDRIDFLKGVARGLQAAHAVGITHCDVKPSNLLLYREPGEIYAKICDFGAAQSAIRGTTALGTAQYMAPELGSGHQATFMSDIFSLGVTFHELLTGDLPNAKDPYDQRKLDERTFFKEKYSEIEYSLEPIGGDENEPLRQMLKEMLLPNPSDRPTISDVVHRLGRAFDTVTRYSMTEERPVSRVEMDTYIWHPEVHQKLGEKMYFFYLDNLALDSWEKLQKRLNEKEIFSFSIHRVIGETDFILRGWFSEQSITHVRTIVGDFGEGVVKGSESKGFMAVDVLPTPSPNALWAKKEYSSFKEWLKHAIEPWP